MQLKTSENITCEMALNLGLTQTKNRSYKVTMVWHGSITMQS